MLDSSTEQGLDIRSVLLWQMISIVLISLLSSFFLLSWFSVLIGGLGVVVSTWHVHRSVYLSGGDRSYLLKAAGTRFGLFLLLMAAALFFLKLQPLELIAGMAAAYIAMYATSVTMIFKKMKGDGLG